MKLLITTFVTSLIVTVVPVQADPIDVDMKAGLWQNNIVLDKKSMGDMQAQQAEQMKAAMEEMKKQFANLPPEQRAQMEAMMKQSGMKITDEAVSFNNNQVQVSQSGTTVKSCITQAEIDRGELPDDAEGCGTTLKKIGDNRYKSTHSCDAEDGAAGESEITFQSPKHYTGKGTMRQVVDGKPMSIAFTMEGTWLASDCGDIKPTP